MTRLITPSAALINKAYLKVKPTRQKIELFKNCLRRNTLHKETAENRRKFL